MTEYIKKDGSLTTDYAAAQQSYAATIIPAGNIVHVATTNPSAAVTAAVGDVQSLSTSLPSDLAGGVIALVETLVPSSQPLLNMVKSSIQAEAQTILGPLVSEGIAALGSKLEQASGNSIVSTVEKTVAAAFDNPQVASIIENLAAPIVQKATAELTTIKQDILNEIAAIKTKIGLS